MATTAFSQTFSKANRSKGTTYFKIEVIVNSQDYFANTSNITINTYYWLIYSSAGYKFGTGYNPIFKLYMNGTNVTNAVVNGYRFPRGTYTSYSYGAYAYTSTPTITSDWMANSYTTTVTHNWDGTYSGTVRLDFTTTASTASSPTNYTPASFTGDTYTFTLPALNQMTYANVNGTWKQGIWYENVSGTWKKCLVYENVSGTWKT